MARFTMERIEGCFFSEQKRARLPHYYPCNTLKNYSNAVRHMIRISTTDEDVQQDVNILGDRAYLWLLYTGLLIHSHIKVMEYNFSKGLIQLDKPGLAEEYSSYEDFLLVAEAHREAREAIQTLYDAGGGLHRRARHFIREMRSAIRIPVKVDVRGQPE